MERMIFAISARSWIAPVLGTRRIHSRSASDHGVDGAVETGNQHLRHVPQRVHSNSTGCCKPDGRRAIYGVREGDELGCSGSGGFGQTPWWISEGRQMGEDGLVARAFLLLHRRSR
ncbi:hypothetical protein LINGRAPRIM_LOCUS2824 [Linum grandiflorum]